MTRRGLATSVLLLLFAAGCGQPLARSADPARSPRRGTDRPCKGDLILVDRQPPDPYLDSEVAAVWHAAGAAVEFPSEAVEIGRRFSVAVRAFRGDPADDAHAEAPATSGAADLVDPVLVEGTGVVIDRGGLILTNHHVVRRTSDLRVWTPRHGWVAARVVGTDPLHDLAVISIDEPLLFTARLTRPGRKCVGSCVAALGFTPGTAPANGLTTLTGRLMGIHRSLQSALDPTLTRYYGDLLESTIPLQPGHSGGALIDASGAVVGLNTAAVLHRRSGRRAGYAIPMSDYIRGIITRLALGEPVVHAYLGVLVRTCDTHTRGVVIEEVLPDSPAARGHLQPGDTILRVNSTAIQSAAHLAELIRSSPPGCSLPLMVRREGCTRQLAVQPCLRR